MKLKQLREAKGWTKIELAHRSRCHPADIGKIESGRMKAYAPMLRRIARALGVQQSELVEADPVADAEGGAR